MLSMFFQSTPSYKGKETHQQDSNPMQNKMAAFFLIAISWRSYRFLM